ncbi:MAG TPA: Hsp70 family protein, partial [Spirochaetota bacterium]|nr:Hsp70 family protein [Spirochaetota bacterium]
QPAVTIHVLQGERQLAAQNRTLGRFELSDIPPAPRGVPQVEVTFDIDANGIVHVSAKDLGTGKEQKIRIESSSGLNEDEINKMVRDAEAHADEDKKAKELIELKNESDNMIYSVEKLLKDNASKVEAAEKEQIEKEIVNLRSALESNDVERIKTAKTAFETASHKFAERMYKEAGSAQQNAGAQQNSEAGSSSDGNASKSDDGKVYDADYEVVDEDKK